MGWDLRYWRVSLQDNSQAIDMSCRAMSVTGAPFFKTTFVRDFAHPRERGILIDSADITILLSPEGCFIGVYQIPCRGVIGLLPLHVMLQKC